MEDESTQSSFIIYDVEFNSALAERVNKNIQVWNANTRGGLVLTTKSIMGHFNKVSIYKALSEGIIKELDPRNEGTTTWDTFEQFENASVKVKRDVNLRKTVDSFRVLLKDPKLSFSQAVGALTADLIALDAIETGLTAMLGAIENEAGFIMGDYSTSMTFKDINEAQFKFGDQYSKVACILVHSDTARALVDLNIDEKLDSIGGFTISTGKWATLGIPVVVADFNALAEGTGAGYKAVILTEGALMVEASETADAFTDIDLDSRPAQLRIKREWAYNVGVKGFTYDTSAGAYPSNAVLADPASWQRTASSLKDMPCVVFKAVKSS